MAKKYQIENRQSGVVLGTYEGESEAEALDAMARDAGYDSYEDSCRVTESGGGDLVVTEVA
jgi:hypothetical protein